MIKMLISKCDFVSSLIKETLENGRDDETIIAYSSNVLRSAKKYIDSYEGSKEDIEELNVYYQKTFSDFIELQVKRMERV